MQPMRTSPVASAFIAASMDIAVLRMRPSSGNSNVVRLSLFRKTVRYFLRGGVSVTMEAILLLREFRHP